MKKSKIIRLEAVDGENHFVIRDCNFEPCTNIKGYSKVQAMRAAKKEASKLLLLDRE